MYSLLMAGTAFLSGCLKPEQFPDAPQIQYQNFLRVFDTGQYAIRGILSFSYTDGNGDIGLNSDDTLPPYNRNGNYYYNLVISYFEKQNGSFVQVNLEPPFSARIPVLTPEDPNKAIKGVIIDTLPLNPKPVYDTIRFEIFIYDRALNKSNVITTPDIILKKF